MKKHSLIQLVFALLLLIVGIVIGYIGHGQPKVYSLASESDISRAEQLITDKYLYANTVTCSTPLNNMSKTEQATYFGKYLKINGYANRAVLRFCVGNISYRDGLLAKDRHGNWYLTDVNMNLNTRVNPKWQRECLIQDITVTDTVVRPENASIDAMNFNVCKKLLQV